MHTTTRYDLLSLTPVCVRCRAKFARHAHPQSGSMIGLNLYCDVCSAQRTVEVDRAAGVQS